MAHQDVLLHAVTLATIFINYKFCKGTMKLKYGHHYLKIPKEEGAPRITLSDSRYKSKCTPCQIKKDIRSAEELTLEKAAFEFFLRRWSIDRIKKVDKSRFL